jgi:hypothetical protein
MTPIRATTSVAHNEYTHWLTHVHADPLATHAEAEMAGVVDGDVGPGRFVGQLISSDLTTRPGFWLGHARYEFRGQRHSFVADVFLTEDGAALPLTVTVTGTVTSGWLKGSHVTGAYLVLPECPIPTPGNVLDPQTKCFQGTLDITRSPRDSSDEPPPSASSHG